VVAVSLKQRLVIALGPMGDGRFIAPSHQFRHQRQVEPGIAVDFHRGIIVLARDGPKRSAFCTKQPSSPKSRRSRRIRRHPQALQKCQRIEAPRCDMQACQRNEHLVPSVGECPNARS
jgi:hypothetical protein